MKRNRHLSIAAAVLLALAAGAGQAVFEGSSGAQGGAQVPRFDVDPLWPKPLSNHWLFGSITGVAVDAQDHVWVVHRGADSLNPRTEMSAATTPPTAQECCLPAPAVLEFDPAGQLVAHWGGPGEGYDWPQSPGGIAIDARGNVWITAAGPAEPPPGGGGRGRGGAPAGTPRPPDAHVLKFSPAGKFLLQIGGQAGLNRPAGIDVDDAAGEVYVADGYGNRRIAVFDAGTGALKRQWGAYGGKPDEADPRPYDPGAPPAKQFRTVSCVKLARDGMVYACDRGNNRVQVFRSDGTFVTEGFVAKTTLGTGSVWDIALSRDPEQRFLYVADGQNQKVHILRRDTLEAVASVGAGGRWPGHFYGVGSIAVDSKGNIYTGENYEGKRVQKFLFEGVGPASSQMP